MFKHTNKIKKLMKLNFTFKKTMRKLLNAKYIAITLIAGMVFIAGCYEFSSIGQPETGHTNSTFEVPLIVHEDDGGNDWTVPDFWCYDSGRMVC
jgi:hypothetical protein